MTAQRVRPVDMLNEHYVYRLFDADDRLIYIGVTHDLAQRLSKHQYGTPWFAEIARVESETFPNRRSAFAAEAQAIFAESPLYNVRHKPGYVEPNRKRLAS